MCTTMSCTSTYILLNYLFLFTNTLKIGLSTFCFFSFICCIFWFFKKGFSISAIFSWDNSPHFSFACKVQSMRIDQNQINSNWFQYFPCLHISLLPLTYRCIEFSLATWAWMLWPLKRNLSVIKIMHKF